MEKLTPAQFEESSELAWLALAYLDAGAYLGRAIIDGDFENSVHRERVPLFLVHQSLELLFKSALQAKRGRYPKSHDLLQLHREFSTAFPEVNVPIPDAVLGAVVNTRDFFPNDPAARAVQHERLRYPADKKGRLWGVA
jgi:HEPN domain